MNRENFLSSSLFSILKAALIVILFTVIMLVLLAFILFKAGLSDSVIKYCIWAIYFFSNLIGGLLIGKAKGEKKFLWGFLTGLTYFILLSICSFIFTKGFYQDISAVAPALFCTLGGGILGGMLA